MDVVASFTTWHQEESLSEAKRSLLVSIDEQAARDEAENAIVNTGLVVSNSALRIVGEVGKATLLAHDLLGTQELLAFIRQHARICVQRSELAPVRRECVVVVRDELRSNTLKIGHLPLICAKI